MNTHNQCIQQTAKQRKGAKRRSLVSLTEKRHISGFQKTGAERWPHHKDSTVKRERYASTGQAGEQSPTAFPSQLCFIPQLFHWLGSYSYMPVFQRHLLNVKNHLEVIKQQAQRAIVTHPREVWEMPKYGFLNF